MRLLICTQTIDRRDPQLGFFHQWIAGLAGRCEHVSVICLGKGEYTLPDNVAVYSLGKERGRASRLQYARRFFTILKRTSSYDAVFVHMNQEYVLLAGWLWELRGKKIYLWRNHYEGSLLTDIAALFCTKIFYTSKFSYTAKYKKSVQMPVGTDADFSSPLPPEGRTEKSILSLGRIAPSKRIEVIIEALGLLAKQGVEFSASIYGDALPEHEQYRKELIARSRALNLSERVVFCPAVPKNETYTVYRAHEIFINASPSGMLDKTIFSAMANGCLPLVSSRDLAEVVEKKFIFPEGDAAALARQLKELLALPTQEKQSLASELRETVAKKHSLETLISEISAQLELA